MHTGFIDILSVELRFPDAASLKDKRMHLRSAKQHLVNLVGCSIAEVDHHEAWQRSRLTLACATRGAADADRLLDDAERWLGGQAYDIVRRDRRIVSLDDEVTL